MQTTIKTWRLTKHRFWHTTRRTFTQIFIVFDECDKQVCSDPTKRGAVVKALGIAAARQREAVQIVGD